jgi:hemerythrin-like domain-containing protein
MSELSTLPLADTSDMAQVHRVFRDAVDSGPRFVAPVAAGDVDRAEYVGTYYDNVLRLLHAHHDGEDELMTPLLVERGTPAEAAEVQRVGDQHEAVLGALSSAEASVAAWRAHPTAETNAAALAALAELSTVLTAHLDEEEAVVVPIAARYMNVAEWGLLPGHAMKHFTGDKLWLILGLVQEQMRPEQIEVMAAHMPPPLLEFWATTGQRMFTDYMSGLRG